MVLFLSVNDLFGRLIFVPGTAVLLDHCYPGHCPGALKSNFLTDWGSEFMGPSESSNNGLLFSKYRKIDHGKSIDFFPLFSMMNFPKVSKTVGGILKFWHPHKTRP